MAESTIKTYADRAIKNSSIDFELYNKYEVKRGLRDITGKGVLAGLTNISEVFAYTISDNELVPCDGELFYRGLNINEIVNGFVGENRFGFEEVCYLLIMGQLPTKSEYREFRKVIAENSTLPNGFIRDTILNAPSSDLMNALAKSVLTLYSYDNRANDVSIENVVRQSLELISRFPLLSVYGYQAFLHYHKNKSLFIHSPKPELSIAENILHMLRPDSQFTQTEAQILDLALVLHADHGGGNNSTFTTHVVTSSGTDTYSSIVASLCSLKGPKHGGANIKVARMFDDIKDNISDWQDEEEIYSYLENILNKKAFDKTGLIYGVGHAVYSLSDPRAVIFKDYVKKLAVEKNCQDEFDLYLKIEKLAPAAISKSRKMYKGVSANVDFYSGFVYKMLNLPEEIYTPLFAVARIAGWCAHRIEELVSAGKIIRPAYKAVAERKQYIKMDDR
ncbi:MAG: citrate/2-methylcitrate synthase [Firmicutes bacterium]|nr:citrate/2-methylcitrate synthase [Bacillota bacterium]